MTYAERAATYSHGEGRIVIYGLIDPRTKEITYVGRSKHVEKRYNGGHHSSAGGPYRLWQADLKAHALKPILMILEIVPEAEAPQWEMRWIQDLRKIGVPLTNSMGNEDYHNREDVPIGVTELECLRCGYRWKPKLLKLPVTCGRCKSRVWNKPKKVRQP